MHLGPSHRDLPSHQGSWITWTGRACPWSGLMIESHLPIVWAMFAQYLKKVVSDRGVFSFCECFLAKN